jgi:hypothetical protein
MTSRERDVQGNVEKVADLVRRLGLQSATLVVLEAGRPLTFLAAQLMWLVQPVLSAFVPRGELGNVATLLEDQESVDALIEMLAQEQGKGWRAT